jgi:hypothetical protein
VELATVEEEEEEAVDAVDAAAMEVTVVEEAMVLSEEATKRLGMFPFYSQCDIGF